MHPPPPLDYATPEKKQSGWSSALAAIVLVVVQLPWYFVVGFGLGISLMGARKDVALDGLIYAAIALPALVGFWFAVLACRPSRWKPQDKVLTLAAILAGCVAARFLIYMFMLWYREVWLDPTGTWDSL